MTYQFINQSRILQFLETLIVSHTYRFKECFNSFIKPLKRGLKGTSAKNKVHNTVNKSTQGTELKKNSQKRLGFSQIRLLSKDCYLPSFFQQASLTHSEKPSFGILSFVLGSGLSGNCSLIASIRLSSKRIFLRTEPLRSSDLLTFFSDSSCIGCVPLLYCKGVYHSLQQDDDLA